MIFIQRNNSPAYAHPFSFCKRDMKSHDNRRFIDKEKRGWGYPDPGCFSNFKLEIIL